DDAVRADQRGDQCLPHDRPHLRHDARRPRQRDDAPALLHLPGRLQLLGHGLCRDADLRAAGAAGPRRLSPIRLPRAQDALSMSAPAAQPAVSSHRADPYAPKGLALTLESIGAILLALLWVLPLAY